MQLTLNDYAEGLKRRDAGLALMEGDWLETAFAIIKNERDRGIWFHFSSDHIRKWSAGAGEPKHPNQRSALVNKLIRAKIIERTSGEEHSRRKEAHARTLKMYRFT